jgi:hypothetical protein
MRLWLVIALALCGCRTTRGDSSDTRAEVTSLELSFDEGKGDLRFGLSAPGLHEAAEIHWQLQLDHRPLASGVAVVTPDAGQLSVTVPVRLKGVRFDDGARRVQLSLTGDAVAQSSVLASPLTFSTQKEVVLVGAPMP